MGARAGAGAGNRFTHRQRRSLATAATVAGVLAAWGGAAAPIASADPACPSTVAVTTSGDSLLSQQYPTNGGYHSTSLRVDSAYGKKGGQNMRSIMGFNLPPIPAGCVVSSAFLRLKQFAVTPGRTIQALEVAQPWTLTTTAWNNQPSTTGSAATPYGLALGWTEWPVTAQVNDQYATNRPYGFLIRDSIENSLVAADNAWYSDDPSYASEPPQLVIRYAPTACPAPGTSGAIKSDQDTYVNQLAPNTSYGSATSMTVQSAVGANKRSLVHFPLPAVPAGCSVVAGQVRLYSRSGSLNRKLDLYQAASPWSESTATWTNKPDVTGSAVTADSANINVRIWNPAADFLNGMYSADNGLELKDQAENASTAAPAQLFDTKENVTSTVPPRLNLLFG